MDQDLWKPSRRRIEEQYRRDLERFFREFQPELFSVPGTESYRQELIDAWAEAIATRVIPALAKANATSWRRAAAQSLQARRIYLALRTELASTGMDLRIRDLVEENARLIRSLPARIGRQITKFVARQQQQGRRSSEIVELLKERLPTLARSKAKLIARTETAKAETALTRARAERLRLPVYEWATSEDERVRPSHKLLDQVLVAWTDPPSPEQLAGQRSQGHYAPGGIYNCRCLALPLVSLDEIQWPHKIYHHGRIETINRYQFERFYGLPKAA